MNAQHNLPAPCEFPSGEVDSTNSALIYELVAVIY